MPFKIKKISPELTKLLHKLQELYKEDRSLFMPLISFLEDEDIKKLNQDENLLQTLIKNIKEKKQALENLDEKKLDQILEEEINFLKKFE